MQTTALSTVQTPGQNVKTRSSAKSKKQALSPARLNRITSRTSREMDFFSSKELVTQTGHEVGEWPLVIVKELVDNALDACEDADIQPVIEVTADACGISVKDNGPGLPETTLQGQLDFNVRVSNREAYVSPCRGAQGNALKTLLPMPHVLDHNQGRFIVEAHGKRHVITCGADPISQRAVIHDDVTDAKCKNLRSDTDEIKQDFSGTEIRLEWERRLRQPLGFDRMEGDEPILAWPFSTYDDCPADPSLKKPLVFALVEGFALFNPHATISLNWFGETTTWKATNPAWEKWKPCRPTSPHWYELRHLERLIGAYVTHDRDAGKDRLLSEFLATFDGLTGSLKRAKVLSETGIKRMVLSELVTGDRLDSDRIASLLAIMQQHTRPVKAPRLGVIGEDHLKARLLDMGVQPESFRYSRKTSEGKSKKSRSEGDEKASFIPWVLESAFGYLGPKAEDQRRIFSGANWSAAIKNPFRAFGSTGEGLETALANMRATRNEPIIFVLHLAHPRIEYVDRGKSALIIGEGE
jgi:hypothetical protein